jgi:hypothetical protein
VEIALSRLLPQVGEASGRPQGLLQPERAVGNIYSPKTQQGGLPRRAL